MAGTYPGYVPGQLSHEKNSLLFRLSKVSGFQMMSTATLQKTAFHRRRGYIIEKIILKPGVGIAVILGLR